MAYNKDTGMYEGYIYKIYNDINDKVYIGQTTTTIEHRWGQHKSQSKKDNDVLYRAIRKYGVDSFFIEQIDVIKCCNKKELKTTLNKKEIYYIEKFNSLITNNGYNMTPGGNANSIYKTHVVDVYYKNGVFVCTCDSASEAARITNTSVVIVEKSCKGKGVTTNNYVYRYHGDDFLKYAIEFVPYNLTEVYQFDLSGKLIGHYESFTQAETKTGINAMQISSSISRGTGFCCGFYWSKSNIFNYIENTNKTKVDQYSLDGVFIKTYDSITEAANQYNTSDSNIQSVCAGISYTAVGFVWRYHKDPYNLYEIKTHCKKIDMYTKNGVFIRTYNSIIEAALDINADDANIAACCRGKANTVKGYVFRYEGDSFEKYIKYKIRQLDLNHNEIDKYTSITKASNETKIKQHIIKRILNGKINDSDEFLWERIN